MTALIATKSKMIMILPFHNLLLPGCDFLLGVVVLLLKLDTHALEVQEPILPGQNVSRDSLVLLYRGQDLVQVGSVPGVRENLNNLISIRYPVVSKPCRENFN